MVDVVCSCVCNVIQHVFNVQLKPAQNSRTLKQERTLLDELQTCAADKNPNLEAICSILPGLKVPSVSIYIALPSPPPSVVGSCRHTIISNIVLC